MSGTAEGRCRLEVDGAARGNPGPAAAAAVLKDSEGRELLREAKALGKTTNNVAEYEALVMGLEAAAERCSSLTVAMDSELVVRQLEGRYRVKQEHLRPLFDRAKELLSRFEEVEVVHVPRGQNVAADELANRVLDEQSLDEEPGEAGSRVLRSADSTEGPAGSGAAEGGRYELTVKAHFDAAHALRGYPGKCKELHGHTWDVEATVAGERLNDIGILFDFSDLKRLLADVLEPLDHAHLNEVAPFDELSPTGENLARFIYERLRTELPGPIDLVEVVVWESPEARLAYRG